MGGGGGIAGSEVGVSVLEGFETFMGSCARKVLEQLRRLEYAVLVGVKMSSEAVALADAGKGLLA